MVSVAEETGSSLAFSENPEDRFSHDEAHFGPDAKKPVFGGLQTTQAQTSLRIRAV